MYPLHADKTNIHKIISFIPCSVSFIISINIRQIVINMRMTMHLIQKNKNKNKTKKFKTKSSSFQSQI